MPVAAIIADLNRAFPNAPTLSTGTLGAYVRDLETIPDDLLRQACTRLVRTAEFFPTIARIRTECAEVALDLPTEEEARRAVTERLNWRRESTEDLTPLIHWLPTRAADAVGGFTAMRRSRDGEIMWAQWAKQYRSLRADLIRKTALTDNIVGVASSPNSLLS